MTESKKETPRASAKAQGACKKSSKQKPTKITECKQAAIAPNPRRSKYWIVVELYLPSGTTVLTIKGRQAWTLVQLTLAGSDGVTPVKRPAPRWSGYVAELRDKGFDIQTIPERHGGVFPGNHGIYVLRSKVKILASSEGKTS